MDVGLLLPYFLWALVALEEHYAMWFLFFFVIPLLDVMFYVPIPDKTVLAAGLCHRMCAWIWLPLVVFTACYIPPSIAGMVSMGVLYNTTLCLADELELSSFWLDRVLADLIGDYLSFDRMDDLVSVVRSFGFCLAMWSHHRLCWHVGSVLVGSLLYDYVCWVEWNDYHDYTVSHYGLANYSMFRLYHSDEQLLPTSHMWVLFLLALGKMA